MTKIRNGQGDGAGPVLLAVGTRPEAIKMAPLLPALRAEGLVPCLLTTGQHGALLDRTLVSLGILPDPWQVVRRHTPSLWLEAWQRVGFS